MSLSGEDPGTTAKQNPHMNYQQFNTRKFKEIAQMLCMTLYLILALKAILSE